MLFWSLLYLFIIWCICWCCWIITSCWRVSNSLIWESWRPWLFLCDCCCCWVCCICCGGCCCCCWVMLFRIAPLVVGGGILYRIVHWRISVKLSFNKGILEKSIFQDSECDVFVENPSFWREPFIDDLHFEIRSLNCLVLIAIAWSIQQTPQTRNRFQSFSFPCSAYRRMASSIPSNVSILCPLFLLIDPALKAILRLW